MFGSWSVFLHFHATGNNVNLLAPQGQFGTRMAGGKDHAAPRYIFTRLGVMEKFWFAFPPLQRSNY